MSVSKNTKVHKRKTQEERSTQTRDRIIRGAAKCIVEQGYKATTMKAIAEAAGVTWGAIQHHFGDKESILHGVTDLGAIEFKARIQLINLDGISLQKRVDTFLGQAREQTEEELYLASMVIFRNKTRQVQLDEFSVMEGALQDIWVSVFGDIKITKKRSNDLRYFTYMSINAIAMERMSFDQGKLRTRPHFKLLNEFLVKSLST